MIVIAIIGILIGAAVYGWKAAQRAGNEAATHAEPEDHCRRPDSVLQHARRAFGTFDQMVKEQMLSFEVRRESADRRWLRPDPESHAEDDDFTNC